VDEAVATMPTIVATSGPSLQVRGRGAQAGGVASSLAAKREADSSS
jgi:hypothetical protein